MNKPLLTFLFSFICLQSFSQTDVSSVMKMKDDTLKLAALSSLSSEYLMRDKADSALLFNQKLIDLVFKVKRYDKLPDAYEERRKIYSKSGNESEALKALTASLNKCRELKFKPGILSSYRNLALYYFSLGECQKAVGFAHSGLQYGDSVNDPIKFISLLNSIGICMGNLGNYNESAAYLLRALGIAESIKDTMRVGALYNNIGQLYSKLEDYSKSKEYILKAILWMGESGTGLKSPYANLAYIFLKHENRPDSALYYCRKIALLAEASGDIILLSKNYLNMAYAFRSLSQSDSAEK